MGTQQRCANCHTVLEDGTKFCHACGTMIEEASQAAYETVFCPECGHKTTSEFFICPTCGNLLGEEEIVPVNQPRGIRRFSFRLKPLHMGIAAAVTVIVIASILISSLGGSSGKNYIIYAKDRELQWTSLSDMKPFELTERLVDDSDSVGARELTALSAYVSVSDDGRYVFYPDRVEGSGVSYYWRDLNAMGKKEPVKIDGEIESSLTVSADGNTLFYVKDDGDRLYVYDRKSGEKSKLVDGVRSYYINDAGNYLIYSVYDGGKETVYEMTINKLSGEKTKIDSDARLYTAYANERKLYYFKEDILYYKESGKDKVKISSDVARVASVVDNSSVYYIKAEAVAGRLSMFVNDDMAGDDRGLAEPNEPIYRAEPVRPAQSDYKRDVWYASNRGTETHPETGEKGNWRQENDKETYNAEVERYTKEHSEWQAERNEMRSAYEEGLLRYQAKERRDALRAALADDDHAVTYDQYSIYYWAAGSNVLIASDVAVENAQYYLAASNDAPIIVYRKYDASDGADLNLSDLLANHRSNFSVDSIIREIRNIASTSRTLSEEIYVAYKEKESKIVCENARDWAIHESGEIYYLNDYDIGKRYGVLMNATVSNGVAGKPVKIDEDVSSFYMGNENKNLYYFKDQKNSSGDMYLNGKLIAPDVYANSLYNFEGSNTLLYYTDYGTQADRGTLCIYKDGKQTKIADDVSYFSPIDEKTITYLTDYSTSRDRGDLMLYTGNGKKELMDTDVTAVLWKKDMIWGSYRLY